MRGVFSGVAGIVFVIGWLITWVLTIGAAFSVSGILGIIFIFFGVSGPAAALILGIFWGLWLPMIVMIVMGVISLFLAIIIGIFSKD